MRAAQLEPGALQRELLVNAIQLRFPAQRKTAARGLYATTEQIEAKQAELPRS